MRRKIDDLLAALPRPRAHTPPGGPHPPDTRRRGGKDRKNVKEKRREKPERDKEDDSKEGVGPSSKIGRKQRDSLVVSEERMSLSRVSASDTCR